MLPFAWLTLLTGLALSGIAAFFSVLGLALIYAGAFWPVVILASTLEVAKLVAVSWLYRYRHLAGRAVRGYFYAATLTLMLITSLGIFGFLTRAHVETEGVVLQAELVLRELASREQQLVDERTSLTTELQVLNEQSSQLVTQLGTANRLRGSSGAVAVQRETTARRTALLDDLKRVSTELTALQRERVTTETDTNKATADIGPLRYVAQAVYGADDVSTIRSAVVALTGIVMVVFDPMAIMLLIAANILFTHVPTRSDSPVPSPSEETTERADPAVVQHRHFVSKLSTGVPLEPVTNTERVTDLPSSLQPLPPSRYIET